MSQARSSALKAHPGKITDEELERERGGSGLRYSLDIKSDGITQEVGVDAKTGKVLENAKEAPHPLSENSTAVSWCKRAIAKAREACGSHGHQPRQGPAGPSRRRGLGSIDGYGPRCRTMIPISVSSSDGRPSTIFHRLVIRRFSEKLDDHQPRCQHPRNTLIDVASNDRRGRGSCCG